jgi:signal transduction histidine kinase
MAPDLSTHFGGAIAERMRADHREIAQRWLDRLDDVLPVASREIFPTDLILDHIPGLVLEIAGYVGGEQGATLATNTTVLAKARELGELRFEQQATVHQLLREYRILGAVLDDFVREQCDAIGPSLQAADAIAVGVRLNEAVFLLLQTTVDTFVGRYTARIEDQTQRLDGFNRMVTHELRQPLSSITHALELLRAPAVRHGDRSEHYVEVAHRNAKRLTQLLGTLGTLALPDPGTLQTQKVDLSKVVTDVLWELRETAADNGVELRSAVPSRTLTVEVSRLELVLINLISNGIKYRDPARGESLVEIALREDGDACLLAVRDNGLGIPAQAQPGIFRRFFRAHEARDAELQNEGMGLGLAIAAECARAMHGSLTFESTEGEGSTFTVRLPEAERAGAPPSPGTGPVTTPSS